jgi:transcription elongation factor Elf1
MTQPDDSRADKERVKCPHCGHHLATRSSRSVTPLYKQKVLQCRNPACGASFGASSGITHQISPSACPRAGIDLPFAAPRARPAAANDRDPRRTSGPEEVPRPDNDANAAGLTG